MRQVTIGYFNVRGWGVKNSNTSWNWSFILPQCSLFFFGICDLCNLWTFPSVDSLKTPKCPRCGHPFINSHLNLLDRRGVCPSASLLVTLCHVSKQVNEKPTPEGAALCWRSSVSLSSHYQPPCLLTCFIIIIILLFFFFSSTCTHQFYY